MNWLKAKIYRRLFKHLDLGVKTIQVSPHDDYGMTIKFICDDGEELLLRFNSGTTNKLCDAILKVREMQSSSEEAQGG